MFMLHLLIYAHVFGSPAVDLIILEIHLCKSYDALQLEKLTASIILERLFKG